MAAGGQEGVIVLANGKWSQPNTSVGGTDAVSCANMTFCVVTTGSGYASAYEGGKWTSQVEPDVDAQGLASVSCAAVNHCVALEGNQNALVFNGVKWSSPILISDLRGGSILYNDLKSVSCPTINFCVAVDAEGNVMVSQ